MNTKLITRIGVVWVVFCAILAISLLSKKSVAVPQTVASAPAQVTPSKVPSRAPVVRKTTKDRVVTQVEVGVNPSSASTSVRVK